MISSVGSGGFLQRNSCPRIHKDVEAFILVVGDKKKEAG